MIKNSKKNITIFMLLVVISVTPIKLQAADINSHLDEEDLFIEMNENEAVAILNNSEQGICFYSSGPTCKLAIEKDKGMVKVAYSIKQAEKIEKIGLDPVKLQKKKQGKWQDIYAKSPYKQNSSYYVGGFIYRNPAPGNTYKSIANFYTTNKGKTNKYYRATNILNF